MAAFFANVAGTIRPSQRGGVGSGADRPAGCRAGDFLPSRCLVTEFRRGVGSGEGGLDIEHGVEAAAAAGTVAAGGPGIQDGAHVAVLDRECDQSARAAGDVPGQSPAEPGRPDCPVRVVGDDLVGEALSFGFAVGPGDEFLDPLGQAVVLQGSVKVALATEVVVSGAEEEFAFRDNAFQDADGVDNRSNGDPGDLAFFTCGDVVSIVVGDALVVPTADQVPTGRAIGSGLGVGAAAGPQSLDYWREGVIPTMRYS